MMNSCLYPKSLFNIQCPLTNYIRALYIMALTNDNWAQIPKSSRVSLSFGYAQLIFLS